MSKAENAIIHIAIIIDQVSVYIHVRNRKLFEFSINRVQTDFLYLTIDLQLIILIGLLQVKNVYSIMFGVSRLSLF